eukprot:jgi/Botrbrau1/489/Bobra.110_2s0125.1
MSRKNDQETNSLFRMKSRVQSCGVLRIAYFSFSFCLTNCRMTEGPEQVGKENRGKQQRPIGQIPIEQSPKEQGPGS